jgi:predicted Rossmann fold flavoprotein
MAQTNLIVIGGGAAGMMAATVAARNGAYVTVVERMTRVGKKLLATGNGRCNLTNTHCDVSRYHGGNSEFITEVLTAFDVQQTLDFFEELGVVPAIEDDGKVFPRSAQASSVLDVLRYEMTRLGVRVVSDKRVGEIIGQEDDFSCVCTDGEKLQAHRVIIAAGGKSCPNLGSNGGGFKLAQRLGHTIVELFPALVQVKLRAPFLKRLKGLKFDGEATVLVNGESKRTELGEILFTEYGLSGPPILQLSRIAGQATAQGKETQIRLNLFPSQSEKELAQFLHDRFAQCPWKELDFSFVGLLHKRLIPVILKEAGFDDTATTCQALEDADIRRLATLLKDWRIPCTGTQSWMDSQVTAGGVSVEEVNADTLESMLIPGVFFAGEVLDVDGDCGGFNLQWAWASGFVAATNAGAYRA